MNKVICVYCSSSDAVSEIYQKAARELGERIGINKDILIFGGAKVGLMGILAKSVHNHNGKVIGVIPEKIKDKNIDYNNADELIVTKDMRERKEYMENNSDAFIALPGGFGTLEEILEVITLKQLAYHNKPVCFININQFFNNLLLQFEISYEEKFAKPVYRKIYYVADTVDDALSYIQNYSEEKLDDKWFKSIKNPEQDLE